MKRLKRNTLGIRFRTVCLLFFLLLKTTDLFPGSSDDIRVNQIVPKLHNNNLAISAVCDNLFSEKIIRTIQSGLPSIVQIEIKLLTGNGREILTKHILRSISYDIWSELYSVDEKDSSKIYDDLAEVKKISSRIDNVILTPKNLLQNNVAYKIQMRVGIIPISSHQGDKVSDWLLDPNQTEETLASDDRASGFKFTLNNLVSFFVGGKKRSKYVSKWFSAETFRIRELK
ncbi:MAG: DUF4390 domain-containing protein [bacterium]